METIAFHLTNPLIYALPFFALLIALEIALSLKHNPHLYYWNDFFASLSIGGWSDYFGYLYQIGLYWDVLFPVRVV